MVSYQLLTFGTVLIILGILYAFLNDAIYTMSFDVGLVYNGMRPVFITGQSWMDFLFSLIPGLIFASGGVWLVARAMKG